MFGRPLAWDDLAWLRSLTTLPIVLKGICHPDDARRAVDEGIDGIYVSTHGGRQANGGLAAIDCLADVAEAVPDVPVLFDSGVRSGSDVVKALALGATAVGIGRPYVVRRRAGRHRRHRARAQDDPGGGRPADGGRRLPNHRRPRPGRDPAYR